MSIAIKAENISKAYQIGEFSTGTISRDIERWWALMRGKEDPFLRIGQTNDRTTKGTSDVVWSLKDINFEINQGDAVGIIGKNGAGKSTLLKVLSRVTTPTTGSFKVKGRIASLLEVGTGFHPELTGKENIYLNGAILGMRKHEIKKHFDAIVDFSGVERYIDTPVKRYSSGMYVRLAFAVAAHLESEILIVDEVLAVGDAEFQKKCLGKMGEVSKGEGRTVLFVSHNIASVKKLCNKGIFLENGTINQIGDIDRIINAYVEENLGLNVIKETLKSNDGRVELQTPYFTTLSGKPASSIAVGDDLFLNFDFNFLSPMTSINPGFAIVRSSNEERVFTCHLNDDSNFKFDKLLEGSISFRTRINLPSLAPGYYHIIFGVRDEKDKGIIYSEKNVRLEICKTEERETGNGILWHTTSWEILK